MKIRMGHVSNSSSSSFTCDICKRTESGRDMGLEELDMARCENGHTFCREHSDMPELDDLPWKERLWLSIKLAWNEDTKAKLRSIKTEEEFDESQYWVDMRYDAIYNVPAKWCPLCQFKDLSDRDLAKWLIKTANMSRSELVDVIRRRYDGDYSQFQKEIS